MTLAEFWSSAWDPKPTVVAGCAALLIAYGWATRLRDRKRAASWTAGVALIALALVSPLDELADTYLFSAHMAKHLLFVLVVPALLLIGLPRKTARRLLRHRPVAAVERVLRRAPVAWACGIGSMLVWHEPSLFNLALGHQPLHIVEHLSLLVGGTIYWWPILSPLEEHRLRPMPDAGAYLVSSCLACTTMGILITLAGPLLYPAYAHPADPYGILSVIRSQWGISPAMDQQIGGLLMWVPGCLVYLTAIMAMLARWYGEEAREAALEA